MHKLIFLTINSHKTLVGGPCFFLPNIKGENRNGDNGESHAKYCPKTDRDGVKSGKILHKVLQVYSHQSGIPVTLPAIPFVDVTQSFNT